MENEEISVLKAFLAKQYADLFKCPSLEKHPINSKNSLGLSVIDPHRSQYFRFMSNYIVSSKYQFV